MYKKEIENRLKELKQELEEVEEQYNETEETIDSLESTLYSLDHESTKIKKEINVLEEDLRNLKFEKIDNKLTGDSFRDSFIKCSYACSKYERIRPALEYVRAGCNDLRAIDGYKGIIIECDEIPKEIQNTFIKWDVRENFKDNAKKDLHYFHELNETIEEGKSEKQIRLRAEKFMDKFLCETLEKSIGKILVLEHGGEKVGFNEKHLNPILMQFDGMDITVFYPRHNMGPMVIESEKQRAIVLPVSPNGWNK